MDDRGFTLIELMVTLAIAAILASVAYPSYQNYLVRGNRSHAQQFLLDLAQRQERLRLDLGKYSSDPAAFALPAALAGSYGGLALTACNAGVAFLASLTPVAGTQQAGDGALFINSSGATCRQKGGDCDLGSCVLSDDAVNAWGAP